MTKKQVETTATVRTSAEALKDVALPGAQPENSETTTPLKTNGTAPATSSGPSNLFISVKTFDAEGKTVGERIVDMYHFGTRNWLQNHHWWAMHNGHCVETNVATQDEITGYLAASKEALAAKFNAPKAVAA